MRIEAVSVTDCEGVSLEIRDGLIRSRERRSQCEVFVAPGLVDIQVNGVEGLDYSSPALRPEHVHAIVEKLARWGTTHHLPTVITGPADTMVRSIKTIAQARREDELVAHSVPSLHVEGPYISPLDGPRGAHPREHIRSPSIAEYEDWQDASGGAIRIVTLAPERSGALPLIERLRSDGVIPSIGHTAATPDEIRAAVDAGATMSTHLGNGSAAELPRLRNFIWEQLAADELTAGVIADGFHVPEAVLRVIARVKRQNRLVLVSDLAPMAGLEVGIHCWGDVAVQVHPDGRLGVPGTPYLAGAAFGLDRAIGNFRRASGWTMPEVLRLCTQNPAQILGIPDYPLSLAEGSAADLVVFRYDTAADTLTVLQTIVQGQELFSAQPQRATR